MAVTFNPNSTLGPTDLNIFLTDVNGNPTNAYLITYAIYFVDAAHGNAEVLLGGPARIPERPSIGEYYAGFRIPGDANLGLYRLRWSFQRTGAGSVQTVVQEFSVTDAANLNVTIYSLEEQHMLRKLRIFLRDNNPDRNYRFRPPEHEATIGAYNRVFGFIWEDEELYEYLESSLDYYNMFPPETEEIDTISKLVQNKPVWKTAIIYGAVSMAAQALMTNWISEEFTYSIGGISLDIEKSSKYQQLMDAANQQFDKGTAIKVDTVKIFRGIKQPRFAGGLSRLGPAVGAGVVGSPRAYVGSNF